MVEVRRRVAAHAGVVLHPETRLVGLPAAARGRRVTGQGPPTTRPPRLKPDEVAAAQRRDAPPKARPAKGAPPKAASTKPPPPAKAEGASTKPPPPAKAERHVHEAAASGEGRGHEGRVEPQAPAPQGCCRAQGAGLTALGRRARGGRPRLRARRVEVRIDEGRRRLRRIAWAAAVAATLVLLAGLTQSPLLAVRHVRVAATAHTSAAELQAASASTPAGRCSTSTPPRPWPGRGACPGCAPSR